MKIFITVLFTLLLHNSYGQSSISGQLIDNKGEAVAFANVALYKASDSSMVKVEISDIDGQFKLQGLTIVDLSGILVGVLRIHLYS